MPFLSFREIIDIIIMTLFVGFIFSGYLSRYRRPDEDPLITLQSKKAFLGVDLHDLQFAALITAPAIIFHELAHKIVAIMFGLTAQFNAAYGWLTLGLVLKLMNFSFIFFVPAYVSISGSATHLQSALIAVAGPAFNLFLWGFSHFALKGQWFLKKYSNILFLTSKVNMFLFFFNMLPFFLFDGYKFFSGMFNAFF
ncbi:MAG: M50 family metallopeptidase [Candidatus Woesearchaeota archaeon]|jgi:Zn-dependent protease|nr:M50 family metallopeptidase [Candidatus Woesearchaeota archaeon]MDP7324136.1 M50 family metallopeptidase [Candidatus Woesearchaeota archaeon]MDP7458216.1 M50 family metallopeptidase [Candidatus Woesearchaeota archaeon]